MKRDTLEKWIFLSQSGELDQVRRYLLNRALARDPELQRFANDVERLMAITHAWSVAQPGPHTAEAIHARLAAPPDRREIIEIRPHPIRRLWPILAGATALILAIALGTLRSPNTDPTRAQTPAPLAADEALLVWDDQIDVELDNLMELVSLASVEESVRPDAMAEDEESLIREWMALEGINI